MNKTGMNLRDNLYSIIYMYIMHYNSTYLSILGIHSVHEYVFNNQKRLSACNDIKHQPIYVRYYKIG